ncbi:unnamed protein product [Caenorhabditis auriculariae]|uniref:Uncharacterized protein n=1 Tax=Caenorhabditis auriculariae TaxID=2777116 RepID=A0A8S1HXP5_9PELO|nr:unnamed protein product [Caenorhabditis auriculariae]
MMTRVNSLPSVHRRNEEVAVPEFLIRQKTDAIAVVDETCSIDQMEGLDFVESPWKTSSTLLFVVPMIVASRGESSGEVGDTSRPA